ncbi:hypothetical protein CcCBS67573_g07076 [Chytriomyces confervae]|uniref:Uncharacterized protein n=1 Tax=Chytriomyces confervae TaxID=246404 RepID=A0A507F079_9FUNG|nr:hypothetical protein CcCBS67573_g07076 [Chytriomyces confervae]
MSKRNKAGVVETARLRDKDAARLQDALGTAKNAAWLDRMAKEMKAQRDWSDKWGVLNDTQLYLGELGSSVPAPKAVPTKWSSYSIINTPKRNPLSSRPTTPDGSEADNKHGTFNSFKVTGNRHDFMSCKNARHPNHPNPTKGSSLRSNEIESSNYSSKSDQGGQYCYDHQTGLYHRVVSNQYKPGFSATQQGSKRSNEPRNHASLASFNNVSNQQHPVCQSRTTVVSACSSKVGNGTVKSLHADDDRAFKVVRQKGVSSELLPAEKYKFPPTSNMEYGWAYQNRKTLEIFGSTSADFTKESWKRAQATTQQS